MKRIKRIVSAVAVVAILGLTPACSTVRDALLKPVTSQVAVPAQVVSVPTEIRKTNVVEVPATVDIHGTVLTSAHSVTNVTVTQGEPTLTTNPPTVLTVTNGWEKRDGVFKSVETAGSLFPGWGQLAAGVFGGFGTLLAAFWNHKAKQANGQAADAEDLSIATIQGIAQFRNALQFTPQGKALDAELVKVLSAAHDQAGVASVAQNLVEQFAGKAIPVDIGKILGDLPVSQSPVPAA